MSAPCQGMWLWQFKNGALGCWLGAFESAPVIYSAWDRSLGRRVYYQP